MKKRIYALIVTYAHLISITMKSNIKVTSNNKTLLALFNTIAHFYYDVIRHVSIEQLWNCTPLIPLKSIIVMSVFFRSLLLETYKIHYRLHCFYIFPNQFDQTLLQYLLKHFIQTVEKHCIYVIKILLPVSSWSYVCSDSLGISPMCILKMCGIANIR